MFNINNWQVSCFVVSMFFVYSSERQMSFHLKFHGTNSQGLEIIYPQYSITYGAAVNLCYKLCKEQWWCSALRKCADRPRLFQCDVVCQFNSFEVGRYTKGKEKCVSLEAYAYQISSNVAANKDVRVVEDAAYHIFYPHYATDTTTICPLNRLFLHTIFTEKPWMEIVLGQSTNVAMVIVYNRQDAGGERFHNALIEVAENNMWRACGFYKGPGVINQIIFVICNKNVRGDTLKITLQPVPGEKLAINLCEVEVFEKV